VAIPTSVLNKAAQQSLQTDELARRFRLFQVALAPLAAERQIVRQTGETMIRDASELDLATIVAIYNASIPGRLATADTEPVSVESRRGWFRDRDHSRHPVWVAEREGRVVGWLSFGKFYGRPAYASTAELSVYVDPKAQRSGIATQLVESAFVFAHNERSVALCRKFGFEQWGHLPRVAILDGVERDLLILGRRLAGEELPNRPNPEKPPSILGRD
jgi:L-amino acid N-acyltransferase YncA